MLNSQLVSDHRDKLAVGWLGFADVDGVTEQMRDAVDVTACPGHFDRMTDRTFHAGRRCFEFLCDCRIQRFGDRTKNFDIVVYHRNGFTQILVTLDMSRDTNLMDNRSDIRVQIFAFAHGNHIRFHTCK